MSTVNLDCKLDHKAIALQARNAEYNPKVWDVCGHGSLSLSLYLFFFLGGGLLTKVLSVPYLFNFFESSRRWNLFAYSMKAWFKPLIFEFNDSVKLFFLFFVFFFFPPVFLMVLIWQRWLSLFLVSLRVVFRVIYQ